MLQTSECLVMNEDAFKFWTPNMAWLLGYIYADGCIQKVKSCDSYRLDFLCRIEDIELLSYIKEFLKAPQKISKSSFVDHRTGKRYRRCSLSVTSKIVFRDLYVIGLRPRKSKLDLPFPNVPDEYLSHFVRGYFDGDGCMYSGGRSQLFFYGHRSFLIGLRQNLLESLSIGNSSVCPHCKYQYVITWSVKEDIEQFYNWFYENNVGMFLKRKKLKFESALGI